MGSEKQYIDLYNECRTMICSHSDEVMNSVRDKAFEEFKRQGFPTKKVERYKYTDVPDQIGNMIARLINRLFGLPAKAVGTRSRVAKDAIQGQTLHHLLGNTGIHRRGGGIIQIDRQLHSSNTSRYGRSHHQTARTLTVTGSTSSLWPWGPPTCFCLSCRCAICLISA